MLTVTDPREVIDFLRKKENRNFFGEGRSITGGWYAQGRHGVCVQLRQFFGRARQGMTMHYEIEECGNRISVEIHSESQTPTPIHDFLREQFEGCHLLQIKSKTNGSYRFATIRISWEGCTLDVVVNDIKKAVDTLYRRYDAYLNYVEGYYSGKGGIEGCKSYTDFMCELTA